MADVFAFLIAGLGLGAIYALLALGIVLLFRLTGVLNFAYAAIGMIAVFAYSSLAQAGWAPGLAAAFVVLAAGPAGGLLDVAVMRHYRSADATVKAVATVALLVGLIGAADLIWGNTIQAVPAVLPTWTATVAGVRIPADRVSILLIALVVLGGLRLLFARTRIGIAGQAMAGDADTAALVGIPVGRLSTVAWGATTMLAAFSLVLIGPSQALNSGGLSLLVIPALAAAVIADLRSPGLAIASGLALGVVESEADLGSWTSSHSQIVPFVVLLVVLLWRQRQVLVPALAEEGQRA